MSIAARRQNTGIILFDNIDDLYNCIDYNNIVWLKIINITFNHNFYFPMKLQQLFINKCNNCDKYFKQLPQNIRYVEITNCRLTNIKYLINSDYNYNNFETLNLSFNHLTTIPFLPNKLISLNLSNNGIAKILDNAFFPEEIQNIDLSFNQLNDLPESILNLNNDCNLILMPNYFWFNSYSNISLNKEVKDYHILIADRFFNSCLVDKLNRVRNIMNNNLERIVENEMGVYNNNIGDNLFIINNIKNKINIKVKTTAEQAQNVHNSDIQDSFSESVITIMKHDLPKTSNYLNRIWYYYIFDGINIFQNLLFLSNIFYNCNLTTIVSRAGVTYGEIMERIWTITQNHNNKKEIRKILRDEINSGIGMCFTGQVTRLVNSLSGFVDGIQISYSENEQINNAVIATMRRCEANELLNILDEVKKVLDILEVPNDKQQIWLNALE